MNKLTIQGSNAVTLSSPELLVVLNYKDQDTSEFFGSRAMLEAEGLIPEGTVWPEGHRYIYWEDGKFTYLLRRTLPKGEKGPRRNFIDCDWWYLCCRLTNSPSRAEHSIMLKTKALNDEIYRQSAKGRAECNALVERVMEGRNDKQFQAFMALVPGFVTPRRGHRPQRAEQSQRDAAQE